MDGVDPYYTQLPDADGESIEEVEVACWTGPLSKREAIASGEESGVESCQEDESCFHEIVSVDDEEPFGVANTVEREEGETRYACEWGYHTDQGSLIEGMDVYELHRYQSEGLQSFWNEVDDMYDDQVRQDFNVELTDHY